MQVTFETHPEFDAALGLLSAHWNDNQTRLDAVRLLKTQGLAYSAKTIEAMSQEEFEDFICNNLD